MQTVSVSLGDGLHEIPKPIFWENKKKQKFKMSSVENFTQSTKHYHFACWVKISEDNILKYFSQKIGSDTLCKLSASLHEVSDPIF